MSTAAAATAANPAARKNLSTVLREHMQGIRNGYMAQYDWSRKAEELLKNANTISCLEKRLPLLKKALLYLSKREQYINKLLKCAQEVANDREKSVNAALSLYDKLIKIRDHENVGLVNEARRAGELGGTNAVSKELTDPQMEFLAILQLRMGMRDLVLERVQKALLDVRRSQADLQAAIERVQSLESHKAQITRQLEDVQEQVARVRESVTRVPPGAPRKAKTLFQERPKRKASEAAATLAAMAGQNKASEENKRPRC